MRNFISSSLNEARMEIVEQYVRKDELQSFAAIKWTLPPSQQDMEEFQEWFSRHNPEIRIAGSVITTPQEAPKIFDAWKKFFEENPKDEKYKN